MRISERKLREIISKTLHESINPADFNEDFADKLVKMIRTADEESIIHALELAETIEMVQEYWIHENQWGGDRIIIFFVICDKRFADMMKIAVQNTPIFGFLPTKSQYQMPSHFTKIQFRLRV